jgi:hypothetical protein
MIVQCVGRRFVLMCALPGSRPLGLFPWTSQMWPYASSSVQGSEFYKRMKVAEGCEKGFVHILDSPEAVERICTRQADYVKVWAPF